MAWTKRHLPNRKFTSPRRDQVCRDIHLNLYISNMYANGAGFTGFSIHLWGASEPRILLAITFSQYNKCECVYITYCTHTYSHCKMKTRFCNFSYLFVLEIMHMHFSFMYI